MPPEVFYKKVACENFAIFTRKHLYWSLRPATLIKKEIPTQTFFCEYWEISKKTILKKICIQLLMKWLQEVIVSNTFWRVAFKTILTSKSNIIYYIILQKYQSLWNQSFKSNLLHISSLNLTATISLEPRFWMFIIKSYNRIRKSLQSLDFLLNEKFAIPLILS